jgi:hypothetical protein
MHLCDLLDNFIIVVHDIIAAEGANKAPTLASVLGQGEDEDIGRKGREFGDGMALMRPTWNQKSTPIGYWLPSPRTRRNVVRIVKSHCQENPVTGGLEG